ncbi:MAG: tetratricopeptide repeat protein [Methylacidiphilales bacterium]|nr:tetratricopeptide repeat protein [Candidatus Methylacidiphilales bacterium]
MGNLLRHGYARAATLGDRREGDGSLTRLQGLAIIAIGIWTFSPVLRGDWLWDDYKYIVHNVLIHDPAGFWKVLTRPDGMGVYDPLTSGVRWLQWQCWGDNTLGYHLTNVGLHLAGAFLLWRLFDRLRIPCAWLGAMIFTVHPLMVESVAWIAELKNTLSLPLLLLAMLAFLDYDEGDRRFARRAEEGGRVLKSMDYDWGWRRRVDYFRALGWFGMSMLAKTTGMMLPVIFLGYAWCKRGTISRSEIKAGVPFFVVALAAGWVTATQHGDMSNSLDVVANGGWAARLASVGWAGLFFLGKVLFPVGLMPDYPGNAVVSPAPVDILPWLLLIGGLGLFWSKRKTWGLPVLAGLGFFMINLVPIFGFIAMNYASMVWSMDHLVYLPIIGLIGLFAAGVGTAMKSLSRAARPLATGAVTLLVAVLAFASHGYAAKFSDEETLWRYAVGRSPHLLFAQEYLGKALLLNNQTEEAKAYFEEVLRQKPQRATSHYDLGRALVQLGRLEEGIAEYRQALALDPTVAEVENNLGTALLQSGKNSEAAVHFERAVDLKPDYALAQDNWGVALAATGQYQAAAEHFARAMELTPDSAEAHDNMGYALLKMGRNEEAQKHFEQALQIEPDDAKAREGLEAVQKSAQATPK